MVTVRALCEIEGDLRMNGSTRGASHPGADPWTVQRAQPIWEAQVEALKRD